MAKEMTVKFADVYFRDLLAEANAAAEAAAIKWLDEAEARGPRYSVHETPLGATEHGRCVGYLLDNCGGAYIQFTDKRDAFYKYCLAAEKDSWSKRQGLTFVPINYSLRCRQEMGLHEAAKSAALKVLRDGGVKNISYRSYID